MKIVDHIINLFLGLSILALIVGFILQISLFILPKLTDNDRHKKDNKRRGPH